MVSKQQDCMSHYFTNGYSYSFQDKMKKMDRYQMGRLKQFYLGNVNQSDGCDSNQEIFEMEGLANVAEKVYNVKHICDIFVSGHDDVVPIYFFDKLCYIFLRLR